MTREEAMEAAYCDEEEFDGLYKAILRQVRNHGTNGVEVMLKYIDQELAEGREEIE
jgi:hypothetical protein